MVAPSAKEGATDGRRERGERTDVDGGRGSGDSGDGGRVSEWGDGEGRARNQACCGKGAPAPLQHESKNGAFATRCRRRIGRGCNDEKITVPPIFAVFSRMKN